MSRYALNLPARLKHEAEDLARRQGISLNQFILWAVAEKVGALGQSLDDPNFPGIVRRRGAVGQIVPLLRGTSIRVQTIVVACREWGLSVAQAAADYDLPEGQVREALAFYDAHRAEVDAAIGQERALEAAYVAGGGEGA
jgi:uncharacterized protein (DUF433 family)